MKVHLHLVVKYGADYIFKKRHTKSAIKRDKEPNEKWITIHDFVIWMEFMDASTYVKSVILAHLQLSIENCFVLDDRMIDQMDMI